LIYFYYSGFIYIYKVIQDDKVQSGKIMIE
jgi:hypothetical protein